MTDSCRWWNPAECDGTESCPPRCPRYVTSAGRSVTIRSVEHAMHVGSDGSTWPAERERVERVTLEATDGEAVVGRASRGGDEVVVTLAEDADPEVGAELVRQHVALAVAADETGSLRVDAPAAVLDTVNGGLLSRRDGDERTDEIEGDSVVESEGDPGHEIDGDPGDEIDGDPGDEIDGDPGDEIDGDSVDGVDGELEHDIGGVVDLGSAPARRTTRSPASRADVPISRDLDALFAPDTVAVVGATDREGAIGRAVVENLAASFDGDIVPVTASRESVLGRPTVDAVDDADADLAVVVLPAEPAVQAVERAARAGVDAIAVLSAGFGEGDDPTGREREARLASIAAEHDVALVGPNALGVCSTRRSMNASFAPTLPDAGGVSILSHSGAMVTAMLDWATAAGVGVRDVVSLGNAAGIDEADVLRYWGADEGTDVIFAYLEDVQDGDRFVEAARAVSRTTPIVALKAGRSAAGRSAAASHTGALAGSDAGFRAAFDETGVVRASSQEAASDAVLSFARQPLPTGRRVAVVTNAGGPGVLATDAVADAAVDLASLSTETADALAERLPDPAAIGNPLDVLGDATVERFVDALEIVLADPGVNAAIVASTPHPLVDHAELAREIGDASRRYGKPVVTCFSGGDVSDATRRALENAGVPNYSDADRAARSLSALASYAAWRREPHVAPEPVDADRATVANRVREAVAAGRDVLGVESLSVLSAYGIETPASAFVACTAEGVDDPDGVREAIAGLEGPFALKVASPDLVHKTDVGGVRVGVDAADVPAAVQDLVSTVASAAPDATISGVLVQELAPDGVECVVGVTPHARFGPLVTVGLGGVLVEHLEDVAHALAPVSRERARELLGSLDGSSVLDGARGEAPVDRAALADAISRLSWLAVETEGLETLEVNPLVATPAGAVAVDLHAELEPTAIDGDSENGEPAASDSPTR